MTPEQEALLEKAKQSLDAALLLAEKEYPDFAVSRAYYTMLYAAEALLLGEGLSFSKHSAVIAAFGKQFAKKGVFPAEFHRFLIEAHDSRTVGDYDAGTGLSDAEARKHIDRARQFLDSVSNRITSA